MNNSSVNLRMCLPSVVFPPCRADVRTVMDPCYKITDDMVNDAQRKAAVNLMSIITGLAKDEYFDLGCDETPAERDHLDRSVLSKSKAKGEGWRSRKQKS